MIIENERKAGEFEDFINSIPKEKQILIVHDTDMDGMTSGVITKKALEKLGFNNVDTKLKAHDKPRIITDKEAEEFPETIIYLDLAAEDFKDIEKLKGRKIIVIDHHPSENDRDWMTIIKPAYLSEKNNPSQTCTANLVYTLFSRLIDIKEMDWLAAAGIIADATYKQEKEFVDAIIKSYGEDPSKDIFNLKFSKFIKYGSYAGCTKDEKDEETLFNELYKAKSPEEAEKSLEKYKDVGNDIKRYFDNFKNNGEQIQFLHVEAKHAISGIISTQISFEKTLNNTLIVYQKKGNEYKINARRQDRQYDMGKLMKETTSKLENANGGGHIPAAGATIQAKDLEEFKKLIIELHETTKVQA